MQVSQTVEKESRRLRRISLTLPIRIEAQIDREVAWSEVTRLSDISAFGAGFMLKRPVKRGRLVQMTMPLPRQLRCYDYLEPQYRIWGLVRRCVPVSAASGESYAIGVAFIGKRPPKSFEENPARLYEISHREEEGLWHITEAPAMPDETHLPKDQRRQSRFHIPLMLTAEKIDSDGKAINSEMVVTENLSVGGAAILSTLDLAVGSFLRINSEQYQTTIISVVRGRRIGVDGITRFHIEFIDRFFPLEGID
jgi:hypothetical protein